MIERRCTVEVADGPVDDVTGPVDDVVDAGAEVTDPPADVTDPPADVVDPPADVVDSLEDATDPPSPCEACLASGKTWQPEADACTDSCAIQDISCYTESCPAPCGPDSCGSCLSQAECDGAGCTWNAFDGLFWCSDS